MIQLKQFILPRSVQNSNESLHVALVAPDLMMGPMFYDIVLTDKILMVSPSSQNSSNSL